MIYLRYLDNLVDSGPSPPQQRGEHLVDLNARVRDGLGSSDSLGLAQRREVHIHPAAKPEQTFFKLQSQKLQSLYWRWPVLTVPLTLSVSEQYNNIVLLCLTHLRSGNRRQIWDTAALTMLWLELEENNIVGCILYFLPSRRWIWDNGRCILDKHLK